jgi:transcriptional regulator with XRE-family HTH domain
MDNKLIRQLETYRLENKITQEELAEHLGVAFSTVNRWFMGRNKPSKIQQYHIEKFLKNKRRFNEKSY